jgi:anti-sigma regulatory factor (Ser/Thr protein kinase)
MQILVITDKADFFQNVHTLCRQVVCRAGITHLSRDGWNQSPGAGLGKNDICIAHPETLRILEVEQNSQNAFAVIGRVCQNNAQPESWLPVSRNDLILRLRELPVMTTEATIVEEVVVQSPHVRLAQFRVPTHCRLIPKLRDRLMRGIQDYRVVEGTKENHFCMALEEALNNAFYHGNLEISSELKEDGSSRFVDLAAERELLSPWCQRNVYVTELVSPFGLWITIRDEGNGFNVQAALDRCNDPEALLASGRGLLLMRGFSDELFFNPAGNEVTLVLYSESQDRELPLGTNSSIGTERRLVVA